MKRNIVSEIKSIKERTKYNAIHRFSERLTSISKLLKTDIDDEVLRYIPIALVACFENFFRLITKDLIDSGIPFTEYAVNFNQSKNIKFDFEIVTAINSNSITIGELISHVLSWNNLDDMNSNISTLINDDFLTKLKSHKRQSNFEDINKNSANFVANSDSIIRDIKRVYELRHIFCHEFAPDIKVEKQEISRCFINSRIFLNHADDYIAQLLYPNFPETQLDMNIHANQEFEKLDLELNSLVSKIKKSAKDDKYLQLFEHSIVLWKEYRTTIAELAALENIGGSIYPMVYAESLTDTTEDKIAMLKEEYEYVFQSNSS